ncbi:MAG: hypothetical protein COZ56_01915, partial [Armatimonadetes bacterium CG_4_8_14_3_um_filter_58_9]
MSRYLARSWEADSDRRPSQAVPGGKSGKGETGRQRDLGGKDSRPPLVPTTQTCRQAQGGWNFFWPEMQKVRHRECQDR